MSTWESAIEGARVRDVRAKARAQGELLDEAHPQAWSFKEDGTPELMRVSLNDGLPPLILYADGTFGGEGYKARVQLRQISTWSVADLQKWYFTRHLREAHPVVYRLFKLYERALSLFH